MTADQIRQAFTRVGITPRNADVEVVLQLGGTKEALAEYVWDHWMGEPDHPTVEQIEAWVDCEHVIEVVGSVSGRQADGQEITVELLRCKKCGFEDVD